MMGACAPNCLFGLLDFCFNSDDRTCPDVLGPSNHVLRNSAVMCAQHALDHGGLFAKDNEGKFCAHVPDNVNSCTKTYFSANRTGVDICQRCPSSGPHIAASILILRLHQW